MSRQPNGGFIGKENITDNTNASGVYNLAEVGQKIALNEYPSARYTPSRSLRFRKTANAYLSRTPSTTGSQTTWTASMWVKQSSFGTNGTNWLMTSGNSGSISTNYTTLSFSAQGFFGNTDKLRFYSTVSNSTVFALESTAVFTDPSAWYHVVAVIDTTQATASNRIRLYINGNQITSFSTATYPSQNATISFINSSSFETRIGSIVTYGSFDGYLTEVNYIDGQALSPESFGEYDSRTSEWKPKRYTGTYGTNGFYLSFANNSSTTTLGLDDGTGLRGYDNGTNDWTLNNFSLTAGSTYDSMTDVPGVGTQVTNDIGGVVRGNYATLSPVNKSTGGGTLSEANLRFTTTGGNHTSCGTIAFPSSGKWYFEVLDTVSGGNSPIGFMPQDQSLETNFVSTNINIKYISASDNATYGFALDMDNLTYTLYKNNVISSNGSSAQGSLVANIMYVPFIMTSAGAGSSAQFNFGQRPFAYTPPAGFKSLCTTNLPDPTIKKPQEQFDVKLWNGNSNGQTIGNTARQRDNYEISRSLRFRNSYLTRKPFVAGSPTVFTWSMWVKRSSFGQQFLASSGTNSTNNVSMYYDSSDRLVIYTVDNSIQRAYLVTNQVFRDTATWYHIMFQYNEVSSISTERVSLFVNGLKITSLANASYPPGNAGTYMSSPGIPQYVGVSYTGNSDYLQGYLAEVHYVDGQALSPESFGVFDVDGSWQAKRYAGTYGVNGFYLPFNDAASATVSAVDVLVIAGGGGGGSTAGGGGGAGGFREATLPISTSTSYTVTVGLGGASDTSGNNSVFSTITSIAGGRGSAFLGGGSGTANTGGSGGGGGGRGNPGIGGSGTVYQGNNGGSTSTNQYGGGGGGGGAGSAGSPSNGGVGNNAPGGAGGSGKVSTISGSSVTYAGGGGGGGDNSGGVGSGGSGGGGSGGAPGNNGTANLGGGGGGGSNPGNSAGGTGGSGVVILKYPNTRTITIGAGLTGSTATSGSFKITTITAGTGNVSFA